MTNRSFSPLSALHGVRIDPALCHRLNTPFNQTNHLLRSPPPQAKEPTISSSRSSSPYNESVYSVDPPDLAGRLSTFSLKRGDISTTIPQLSSLVKVDRNFDQQSSTVLKSVSQMPNGAPVETNNSKDILEKNQRGRSISPVKRTVTPVWRSPCRNQTTSTKGPSIQYPIHSTTLNKDTRLATSRQKEYQHKKTTIPTLLPSNDENFVKSNENSSLYINDFSSSESCSIDNNMAFNPTKSGHRNINQLSEIRTNKDYVNRDKLYPLQSCYSNNHPDPAGVPIKTTYSNRCSDGTVSIVQRSMPSFGENQLSCDKMEPGNDPANQTYSNCDGYREYCRRRSSKTNWLLNQVPTFDSEGAEFFQRSFYHPNQTTCDGSDERTDSEKINNVGVRDVNRDTERWKTENVQSRKAPHLKYDGAYYEEGDVELFNNSAKLRSEHYNPSSVESSWPSTSSDWRNIAHNDDNGVLNRGASKSQGANQESRSNESLSLDPFYMHLRSHHYEASMDSNGNQSTSSVQLSNSTINNCIPFETRLNASEGPLLTFVKKSTSIISGDPHEITSENKITHQDTEKLYKSDITKPESPVDPITQQRYRSFLYCPPTFSKDQENIFSNVSNDCETSGKTLNNGAEEQEDNTNETKKRIGQLQESYFIQFIQKDDEVSDRLSNVSNGLIKKFKLKFGDSLLSAAKESLNSNCSFDIVDSSPLSNQKLHPLRTKLHPLLLGPTSYDRCSIDEKKESEEQLENENKLERDRSNVIECESAAEGMDNFIAVDTTTVLSENKDVQFDQFRKVDKNEIGKHKGKERERAMVRKSFHEKQEQEHHSLVTAFTKPENMDNHVKAPPTATTVTQNSDLTESEVMHSTISPTVKNSSYEIHRYPHLPKLKNNCTEELSSPRKVVSNNQPSTVDHNNDGFSILSFSSSSVVSTPESFHPLKEHKIQDAEVFNTTDHDETIYNPETSQDQLMEHCNNQREIINEYPLSNSKNWYENIDLSGSCNLMMSHKHLCCERVLQNGNQGATTGRGETNATCDYGTPHNEHHDLLQQKNFELTTCCRKPNHHPLVSCSRYQDIEDNQNYRLPRCYPPTSSSSVSNCDQQFIFQILEVLQEYLLRQRHSYEHNLRQPLRFNESPDLFDSKLGTSEFDFSIPITNFRHQLHPQRGCRSSFSYTIGIFLLLYMGGLACLSLIVMLVIFIREQSNLQGSPVLTEIPLFSSSITSCLLSLIVSIIHTVGLNFLCRWPIHHCYKKAIERSTTIDDIINTLIRLGIQKRKIYDNGNSNDKKSISGGDTRRSFSFPRQPKYFLPDLQRQVHTSFHHELCFLQVEDMQSESVLDSASGTLFSSMFHHDCHPYYYPGPSCYQNWTDIIGHVSEWSSCPNDSSKFPFIFRVLPSPIQRSSDWKSLRARSYKIILNGLIMISIFLFGLLFGLPQVFHFSESNPYLTLIKVLITCGVSFLWSLLFVLYTIWGAQSLNLHNLCSHVNTILGVIEIQFNSTLTSNMLLASSSPRSVNEKVQITPDEFLQRLCATLTDPDFRQFGKSPIRRFLLPRMEEVCQLWLKLSIGGVPVVWCETEKRYRYGVLQLKKNNKNSSCQLRILTLSSILKASFLSKEKKRYKNPQNQFYLKEEIHLIEIYEVHLLNLDDTDNTANCSRSSVRIHGLSHSKKSIDIMLYFFNAQEFIDFALCISLITQIR